MTKLVPFSVIGGFLGAGKTTLINQLLKNATGRYAILVNDFGRLNIDEKLILEHDGETIALANGCICCSLAAGFSAGLGVVLDKIEQFDHVFVEASGVANPQRIQDIARIERALLPCANVVLVDASQIQKQIHDKHIGRLVLEQIQAADLLIVNKQALITDQQERELNLLLEQISVAHRYVTNYSQVPVEMILQTKLHVKNALDNLVKQIENHDLHSTVLCLDKHISREQFETWCQQLSKDVLRGKGVVRFCDSPVDWLWQKVGEKHQLTAFKQESKQIKHSGEILLIAKRESSLPKSFQ